MILYVVFHFDIRRESHQRPIRWKKNSELTEFAPIPSVRCALSLCLSPARNFSSRSRDVILLFLRSFLVAFAAAAASAATGAAILAEQILRVIPHAEEVLVLAQQFRPRIRRDVGVHVVLAHPRRCVLRAEAGRSGALGVRLIGEVLLCTESRNDII